MNNNDGYNNNNNQQGYHYYSYGKPQSDRDRRDDSEAGGDRSSEGSFVEMTPPRELKMYPSSAEDRKQQHSWSYSEAAPRRSAFKSVLASFLAGAVVVGSLMFASDRLNLFSGSDVLANNAGTEATQAAAASPTPAVSGGATTASIDIVRPNTIAAMVKKASPAVVKIETYSKASSRQRSSSIFEDPLFREFFGDGGSEPEQEQPDSNDTKLVPVGTGSGFIFENNGYILTNEHVVDGADQIKVIVDGVKEPYVAKLLGTAYELDLAVLKIEGSNLPVLPLGSSEDIQVGDWVVAIGNPYEFEHTVTVGVLSAKERSISIPDSQGTRNYQALLQTDASINPGNSGGPLLNLNGEVVGINTAVNAQAQGIGFAIPTSTITEVLGSLKENKAIPRPYIGIRMENVPEEYVDDLGLKDSHGAFVREVLFNSPAHKAGIQVYDVILSLDGVQVDDIESLSKAIGKKKPGDKAALKVMRNGKEVPVNLTIGDMNEQKVQR